MTHLLPICYAITHRKQKRIQPLQRGHAYALSLLTLCHTWYSLNMVSYFPMSRHQTHMTSSFRIFSYFLRVFNFCLSLLWIAAVGYHHANTCTNWGPFSVYLKLNRCLLTKYRMKIDTSILTWINLPRPFPSLKMHYYPINQTIISPSQQRILNKRPEVIYLPRHQLGYFLRSQIFKKSTCGSQFKFQ